jgi:hypothetical protein
MCSFPYGKIEAKSGNKGYAGYLNECMTGFEWQAAAHMIFEGKDQPDILQHGLAIGRAIHDRYSGHLRNPYNEIECSDHYSRAMASFGVFQAVCGYENHGPKGHLGFSPRLTPENFRSAFTASDCWGTFEQQRRGRSQTATIAVHDGSIELRSLALEVEAGRKVSSVHVSLGAEDIAQAGFAPKDDRIEVSFSEGIRVAAGSALQIELALV